MDKRFEQVTELDEMISNAYDEGNMELADELQNKQDAIVESIENDGLRSDFDAYIKSIS